MGNRIPPFSSQTLEAACRVLADTSQGLTGNQIESLLRDIKVQDVDPLNTKWKRLFNALARAQNNREAGNHLIQFINLAMNPVSYARDRDAHTNKATTVDEARARVGRLNAALEARTVHDEVFVFTQCSRRTRGSERGSGYSLG